MSYDQNLARRIRDVLGSGTSVVEKKMFGGLSFMVDGHMCCGVLKDTMIVRVGPDAYEDALRQPHARPMDFTGKPLKGMVYVDSSGTTAPGDLADWIQRGLDFVATLPPK